MSFRPDLRQPKPDEPTGLGAVVEDAKGDLWVRLDHRGVWACASDENKTATFWPTITAVKVLSEGWAVRVCRTCSVEATRRYKSRQKVTQ